MSVYAALGRALIYCTIFVSQQLYGKAVENKFTKPATEITTAVSHIANLWCTLLFLGKHDELIRLESDIQAFSKHLPGKSAGL